MFYVYILQSEKDDTFYTGLTSDLQQRLHQHNTSDTKSTRAKKPWKLIYSEIFTTRIEARKREKYLKSGIGRESRAKLLEKSALE